MYAVRQVAVVVDRRERNVPPDGLRSLLTYCSEGSAS